VRETGRRKERDLDARRERDTWRERVGEREGEKKREEGGREGEREKQEKERERPARLGFEFRVSGNLDVDDRLDAKSDARLNPRGRPPHPHRVRIPNLYRGASLIRNRISLGTYSREMPRPLWWS